MNHHVTCVACVSLMYRITAPVYYNRIYRLLDGCHLFGKDTGHDTAYRIAVCYIAGATGRPMSRPTFHREQLIKWIHTCIDSARESADIDHECNMRRTLMDVDTALAYLCTIGLLIRV